MFLTIIDLWVTTHQPRYIYIGGTLKQIVSYFDIVYFWKICQCTLNILLWYLNLLPTNNYNVANSATER